MKKLLTFLFSLLLTFTCINVGNVEEVKAEDNLADIITNIYKAKTIYGYDESTVAKDKNSTISINGVDYYVLRRYSSDGNDYAELITKNIYDVRFGWTVDYSTSDLQKWMNESFYNDKLKNSVVGDNIVPQTINYYIGTSFEKYQLTNQYVYAFDGRLVGYRASKFNWSSSVKQLSSSDYSTASDNISAGFWTTAAAKAGRAQYYPYATVVRSGGTCITISTSSNVDGARPIFTMQLSFGISAPTSKQLTYTGKKLELIEPGYSKLGTIKYSLDGINFIYDNNNLPKATEAGTYKIWYEVNGVEATLGYVETTINKAVIFKPNTDVVKTYTAAVQDNNYTYIIGANREGMYCGKDVGTYVATYVPDDNHTWDDGTSDEVSVTLTINPMKIYKPSDTDIVKTYTGETLTNDYTLPYGVMMKGKDSGVNVGEYKATYYLASIKNLVWSDGTTDDVTVTLTIVSNNNLMTSNPTTKVEEPTELLVVKEYTGEEIANGYTLPEGVNVDDESKTKAIDVGEYKVKYTLQDGYTWLDGTSEEVEVTLIIEPKKVSKPSELAVTKEYTGEEITNGYEIPEGVMMSNDSVESGTNVGIYKATYKPTSNYVWEDGTDEAITITLNITPKLLTIPTLDSNTYAYTGKDITPTVLNYDSSLMELFGDLTVKDINTYMITISLLDNDNYAWEDGSPTDNRLVYNVEEVIVTPDTCVK